MATPDHVVKLDYSFIADGIYVGTNACCTDHLAEMLRDEGVTVDISLEDERLDQPFGVEAYLWLPVEDHTPPARDQLAMGVAFIAQAVSLNKKIYVHCKNGHGRAPTLVAAYFVTHGKTSDAAFALIKSQRPSVHLQDEQIESVRQFAA